ncbi:MAG: methyltransferase domain-containing protein [Gemmatimonadales bacterium]
MIGTELLDDPGADPAVVAAHLGDIARLNRWFGATRAVIEALEPHFRQAGKGEGGKGKGVTRWTLLDVGTGAGDIPRAVAAAARRHGITLTLVGVERIRAAASLARASGGLHAVVSDGSALPFASGGVDVVVASQVLHHLPRETAVRWIAAFDRVARRAVAIADLRRSRPAIAALWLAGPALGIGRVTQRDGVVSLRRGYTRKELDAMLREAGVPARSRYCRWSRVVAAWVPHAHRR